MVARKFEHWLRMAGNIMAKPCEVVATWPMAMPVAGKKWKLAIARVAGAMARPLLRRGG
jgi:hypothetical protein